MKEARVTCTCNRIRIADLGLTLVRGEQVWLSLDQAKASRDLLLAQRSRGVVVQQVERCQEQRPAPNGHRKGVPIRVAIEDDKQN